ncbi:protein LZIC-like [Oratosquilla oratoria]|uniref:protein LZIC-like n=1 Tax=Oratosquilla oratoria TaxID=337810 RepID=UPI003F763122
MTSRGASETAKLRKQLEEQLDRLVAQLSDLEECKAELEPEEYEDVKKDTLEQLTEFEASLTRMASGDMTLVDSINAMQLAIQAAISEAFHTPEVIQMFAKKQPDQLREKLSQIERDFKIGKLTSNAYQQQKVEVLSALQKLGDVLEPQEQSFISTHASDVMKNFVQVGSEEGAGQKALEIARQDLQ